MTALRRTTAGALTFLLAYVLVGLVALPWIPHILRGGMRTKSGLLTVYESANEPVLTAIGWILLNVHGATVVVSETGRTWAPGLALTWITPGWNPTLQAGFGWMLILPAVASFLGGIATVNASSRTSPIPLAVGSYMAVGYTAAAFASFFLFRVTVTRDGGPVTAFLDVLSLVWLLPVVGLPLVFGSVGAFVGNSPYFDSLGR